MSGYYTPEEAQDVFLKANEAYAREDYAAAQQGYEKLLSHGHGGPDVLYNLGTSHLARGDLGRAVLALEQAKKEGARAPDLEANLAVARARQVDKVVGATAEEEFLPRVTAATDGTVVAWTFLGTWVAAFALVLLWRALRPGRRTAVGIMAALLFTVAVPSGLLLAAHAWVEETVHEAVVLAPTLVARELPQAGARSIFEVHAGLKVRLLEETGRFVRIRLPNGLEGWAEREGVAEI
ncbi:SH3 domain-containing protein [Pyxidicoccus sp. MSG2]|uniref:SH3 domain-containing protein n=1 Tax=Pyxidicoccus sp. MSG2 TaxID=2996790 RepID=UPI00226FA753|nr:SH3 domain-containing protein [Pyxidicoccus sp. MSG2]MCY1020849.1 SH3 domain-containing protein [Pyxidicoccus sp. MSG2]